MKYIHSQETVTIPEGGKCSTIYVFEPWLAPAENEEGR